MDRDRFKRFALLLILINTTVLVLFLSQLDAANGQENVEKEIKVEKIADEMMKNSLDEKLDSILKKRRSPMIFDGPQNNRQQQIVDAFLHGWREYRRYAWGKDELRPVRKSFDDEYGIGLTILDSLDTAIIMGLEDEVRASIDWLEHDFSFKDVFVNTFETTIRALGGLLSSYHLTGEPVFQKYAELFGEALLSAFNGTHVPLNRVNLLRKHAHNYFQYSNLAEVSSFQLEFRDLFEITKDRKYLEVIEKTNSFLSELGCPEDGICFSKINVVWKNFEDTSLKVGARTDSFYEYLLKQFIQTHDKKFAYAWNNSMEAVRQDLYRNVGNGRFIVGELELDGTFVAKMEHFTCFLPGSLVKSYKEGINKKHLEMAENLAETCYKMYNTPTGLAPEMVYWKGGKMVAAKNDKFSLLRPEAIESFFYLYRATRNEKYREWSWKIFESIQKYAKVPSGGYSSIKNVFRTKNIERIDKMESFFLAETLKYLYLIMDDKNQFPLGKWVFNTEAHPLPIYGRKVTYFE